MQGGIAFRADWLWADRRLEREYVYAADPSGYVDECVAQLVYTEAHAVDGGGGGGVEVGNDTSATVLYVLSDHNANVIGLTNSTGQLIAQYGYTPYGELRSAEYFAPDGSLASAEAAAAALGNRLGHQGLRVERFDRPWDAPMPQNPLEMGAAGSPTESTGACRAVCHNRNRIYDPAEGRFLSRDPNGLGVPTLSDMAYGGVAITASDVYADLMVHYGDGMNSHIAYGATPRSTRDASGLWINPVDVAGAAVMGVVRGLRGGLESLTEVYADNMEYDLDWAMDWGAPDDWHTRLDNSWVGEAWNEGVRGGLRDWLNEDVKGLVDPFGLTPDIAVASGRVPGPTATWVRAARAVNKAGRIAHHVISYFKNTYRRMKDIEKDFRFTFDLHSLDNMLPLTKLQHGGGRHRLVYHNKVFGRLRSKLEEVGKFGEEAKQVFLKELEDIKGDIRKDPDEWFRP